ncbi:hypothetical protein CASFOL_024096 [Castilleja foliolosa]|uniref:AMP-activated protein kinase glycogen-binding domain-containing protein n=1 Tax=Castilleja foliolosa TaxID=1961234 RepID=A0ABD3CR96_9LAMI
MLTLTTTYTHIPNHHRFSRLNSSLFISSLKFESNPQKRVKIYRKPVLLNQFLGFIELRSEKNLDYNWSCCWCKRSEGEGDVELEAEIMDFMAKSEKPTMFPTKKELIGAGREDLAVAIEKKGGWYLLGWQKDVNVGDNLEKSMDFDIDVDIAEFQRRVESCKESASLGERSGDSISGDENVGDNVEKSMDFDMDDNFAEFQRRIESCKESSSFGEHSGDSISGDDNNEDGFSSEVNMDFLQLDASASLGRSLEIGEDSGIEGILSRLEKQRNSDFGLNLGTNGSAAHDVNKDDTHFDTSLGIENGTLTNQKGKISRNSEPENWRTWSDRRAGFRRTEFEAAEISFSKDRLETDKECYHDGMFVSTEDWINFEQINHSQIRTRLQHLECELTSALDSLRSKRHECISDEVTGSSSDLRKLSDAWEFQQNELMSGKERLRSMRAKLAVLEGKMALAIIDAQKIVNVKQKRIDGACKALQLLRTTFIVWHSSASEVLLAGSFDGWTSQRKMDQTSPDIFSMCLKLYPGRYEIKFIVDGVWKVDPLLPVVNNNGYENNLFIVT